MHPLQTLLRPNFSTALQGIDSNMQGFNINFDDLFQKAVDGLKQAGQSGIDKLKQEAIANSALAFLNDPNVRAAVVAKGEETVVTQWVNDIIAGRQAVTGYVASNPYKTAIMVGAVALGGFAIYKIASR